jgi:hypothetical protein
MPIPPHDDVIMHRNPQRLCDVDDRFRHLDVRLRRRGIAAWMIVQQYSLTAYRIELESIFVEERNRWGRGLGSVFCDPS